MASDSFQPIPSLKSRVLTGSTDTNDFFNSFNTSATPTQEPGFLDSLDLTGQGGKNLVGGINAIGSLANAYNAYRQYQLGKDTLRQNRAAFNTNLANQAKVTNAQIDDRELRRAAERSDLAGDFSRIQAAAEANAAKRRVSGAPI